MTKDELKLVHAELLRHATDSESLDEALEIVERELKGPMKMYKARASYIVHCEAEFEAQNEAQAYEIAWGMSGDEFVETDGLSDWTINTVDEIK